MFIVPAGESGVILFDLTHPEATVPLLEIVDLDGALEVVVVTDSFDLSLGEIA